MMSPNTSKGFLTDARLRGEYKKFLNGQSTYKRNTPGLDYNASGQGQSAVQGTMYQTRAAAKPRLNFGQQVQNTYRNRPNEQAGLATPAQPATAPTTLPMRRSY